MEVINTERLVLRHLCEEDAAFILELVNDSDWLRYIGDRGVKTLNDARGYILNGPMTMYKQFGFGLYRVELRDSGMPIGLCGLLKRDSLEDADIGFAFLPQYRGCGYAFEAAAATLEYGTHTLGLARIVAIVSPENTVSIRLLEKLGLRFEQAIRLPNETRDASLYLPTSSISEKPFQIS
ncbi:MAG TPA: GNAT family N-acetyltransferase [Gammaproteobacteria bacterium]|nr:GNAT family N-acetyltransferase [Gammaproteobacteria bacterium]